jgi:hypothetical protein
MMRKFNGVWILMTVVWMLVYSAVGQPPFEPGGPPPGQPNPEEMAKRMMEMRERMLDQMDITSAEKTAAKEALKTKTAARTKLMQKVDALRNALNEQASNDVLKKRMDEFQAAHADYFKAVVEADQTLMKKVSARAGAMLVTSGFIEGGMGGGPGGGRGGPGGRPGGGPGGPPGGGRPGGGPPPPRGFDGAN